MNPGLARLNALSREAAESAFLACCGSRRWARRMAARRPFRDSRELVAASDEICRDLSREDWLEAFAAHPRIGENIGDEPAASKPGGHLAGRWSAQEQSRVPQSSAGVAARLAEGNRAYRRRFGYIFIVCATGKSAQEMLAILERRLQNDPAAELPVAAEQQHRITRLRLEKLLAAEALPGEVERRREESGEGLPQHETSGISTHVLDTARGRPAVGVSVTLELRAGTDWTRLGDAATDETGRAANLLPPSCPVQRGTYRLRFDTASYYRAHSLEAFYPEVCILFEVRDPAGHYHVPLLLSPWGYTTYRGS